MMTFPLREVVAHVSIRNLHDSEHLAVAPRRDTTRASLLLFRVVFYNKRDTHAGRVWYRDYRCV
jgi:hypothetical protein